MSEHTKKSVYVDVIVVGGGHAGIEAAYAAARMGATTVLISLNKHALASMPCNPAIGGVGKGHIVFEISALGGLMPMLCTQTYLQARMLNTRKGPAVQGLRLQIDKHAYSTYAHHILSKTPNLTIVEAIVEDILLNDQGAISGVVVHTGDIWYAPTVVITTGTFMNGKIHIGNTHYAGGRRNEKAVSGISAFLHRVGLTLGRLKTGTPPRLLRRSLDFSRMTYQEPDTLTYLFDFYPHTVINRRACYITYTNEATHTIIRDNLTKSAMYSGAITGIGPRYCPSIEDKIGRFKDKSAHHVFVEPEDATDEEIYPNGISTSLPIEIQQAYVRTIPGLSRQLFQSLGMPWNMILCYQIN
jgi:tRNA uridine 5-carboxymethylaminomethyl modification enzyme